MIDPGKRHHSQYSYLIIMSLYETADVIYDTLLRNSGVNRSREHREQLRKRFLRMYCR